MDKVDKVADKILDRYEDKLMEIYTAARRS